MENPGDEGNLVQEAEILKAFSIVAGVRCEGRRLTLHAPPAVVVGHRWSAWTGLSPTPTGGRTAIRFTVRHERWLRRCTVELEGIGRFEGHGHPFRPVPPSAEQPEGYETELIGNASWIWVRGIKGDKRTITVEL